MGATDVFSRAAFLRTRHGISRSGAPLPCCVNICLHKVNNRHPTQLKFLARIKAMSGEKHVRAFFLEAKTLAGIRHPHIIGFMWGYMSGPFLFATELCKNGALGALIGGETIFFILNSTIEDTFLKSRFRFCRIRLFRDLHLVSSG